MGLLVFVVGSVTSFAGNDHSVRRWTIEEGLPQSTVSGLEQSTDGYLWLATFGGIARFDGSRFEVTDPTVLPALPGNRFLGVAEDGVGTLWFNLEGIGVAGVVNGEVASSFPQPGPDVGGPWVDGSGQAFTTYAGKVFSLHREALREEAMPTSPDPPLGALDEQGWLWLLEPQGARCVSNGCVERGTLVPPSPALAARLVGSPHGLKLPYQWPMPAGCPPLEGHHRVAFRWGDRLWCGMGPAFSDGESSFDLEQNGRLPQHPMQGVASVLIDREGSLWMGSMGGGLFLVQDLGVQRFAPRHQPADSAWAVTEGGGHVWAAYDRHTEWIGEEAPEEIRSISGTRSLSHRGDEVWLAGAAGLLRWRDGRLERVVDTAFDAVDAGGVATWAANDDELVRIDRSGRVDRWPVAFGPEVTAVREAPDGAAWVSAGVAHAVRSTPQGQREEWTAANGLPEATIRDFRFQDGDVWAGTYGGGLVRIRGGRLDVVTTRQGLCENVVSRMASADGGKTWWMLGNRGTSRVDAHQLAEALEGRKTVDCELYRTGEGNWNGGFVSQDGRLWFTTTSGVIRVDPDRLGGRRSPPQVFIERLVAAGLDVPEGTHLAPGPRNLRVAYTALGLADHDGLMFRRRLRGSSDEWEVVREQSVTYPTLGPGTYVFEVSARGPRSDWSAPQRRQVTFDAAWSERPEVWTGLAAVAGLVLVGVYGWRLWAAARRTRELRAELVTRLEAEAVLREREVRYRTLFESTSDALFVHDAEGRLLDANRAARALVGDDPSRLEYVDGSARAEVHAVIAAAAGGAPPRRLEVGVVAKSGEVVATELLVASLQLDGVSGALVRAVDRRELLAKEQERRALEAQVDRSRRLDAVAQLAGGIAHDFNNLLTVVTLHAESLKHAVPHALLEDVEAIDGAAARARALTAKMMVSGASVTARDLSFDGEVRAQLDFLRRLVPRDIALDATLACAGAVHIDPSRFEQVLLNLVSNASQAVGSGGRIRVTTHATTVDASEAVAHGVSPGDFAVLEVRDDGPGIEPEISSKIFEPFFTTKPVGVGTGLGLATVWAVVREARGYVTVRSRPGDTCFRVALPTVAGPAPAAQPVEPAGRRGATSLLLVDDDDLVRRPIARLLRAHGYQVADYGDPLQALSLAQEFDVLVTDVVMPGLTGPELAQQLGVRFPDLRTLYLSAHTRDLALGRGVREDFAFVGKPFQTAELLAALDGLLERTPAHGARRG